MKSYISNLFMAFSFLTIFGLAAATASAQVDESAIFRVDLPFAFNIRDRSFPAGEYIIKSADEQDGSAAVMQIQSVKAKGPAAFFDTFSISMNDAPKRSDLIFEKVDGKYYLSEIWQGKNSGGSQVIEPLNMNTLEHTGEATERQAALTE